MSSAPQTTSAEIFQFTQSGALLQNVMDNAAVGMALVGADGRLLYANASLCQILGYSESDLQHLSMADLTPVDEVSGALVQFERLKAGKIKNFRAECRCRNQTGDPVWVSLSASVLENDDVGGTSRYFIFQLSDIQTQKQAEEALAYNEARWDNALEAAGQGVWDHDIRKDEMFYSRMWRRMRGFGDDEPIDGALEAWFERIHPDDLDYIKSVVKKQDNGDQGHDALVYRERHRDGHYIWIWSRGKPIEWDEHGTPIRTVGTDTDITHMKEIESQLADEKERLRVTLQSIGDGVISTDASGAIIFMNSAAEQMIGWQSDDAIGKLIGDVFDSVPESNENTKTHAVQKCLASGKVFRAEEYSRLTGLNGSTRYIRETASPLCTAGGAVIGTVMVFQDTTARRKMQQELAYSATHDSLTRLPNRMAFDTKLENAIAGTADNPYTHALCLIDLDHFKQVNDKGGHAAGDALLREVATCIRAACGQNDFAARIGGDEFAAILSECCAEEAIATGQKIIDAISGLRFSWDDEVFQIGASIGIAVVTAECSDPDELYRRADDACYAAKANGRNCLVVAGDADAAS